MDSERNTPSDVEDPRDSQGWQEPRHRAAWPCARTKTKARQPARQPVAQQAMKSPWSPAHTRPPRSSSRRPRTPRRCRPPRTSSSATRSPTTCSPSPGTPRAAGARRRSSLVSCCGRGWSCAVVGVVGHWRRRGGLVGGVPWSDEERHCRGERVSSAVRPVRLQGWVEQDPGRRVEMCKCRSNYE